MSLCALALMYQSLFNDCVLVSLSTDYNVRIKFNDKRLCVSLPQSKDSVSISINNRLK